MAPPQIFINSKRLELKKQQDNKEDGLEESGAEKKDSDVADTSGPEESNGEKTNRIAKSLHPLVPVLVGQLAAFVGVSFKRSKAKIMLKFYFLSRPFC